MLILSFLAAMMLDSVVVDTTQVDSVVADTMQVDSVVADTMQVDSVVADTTQIEKAKADSGFVFTTVDSVAITPVKDQHRSSTCWAFSTLGFLESEVLRIKGIEIDFAEMYVVSKTMMDRATYCVRMYNEPHFSAGGSAYDVIYCMKHYGLVPQAAMPGIRYSSTPADTLPVHTELDKVARGYLNALTGLKKLTPVWREGLQAIYDTYLGKCPREFAYDGQMYTPQTYVESLGLDADDYVSLTSYTHHPFYQTFALEVPDNWRMDQMYNLPIDELMEVIDNALANGFTMAWGADVSEVGFTRKGIGVIKNADELVVQNKYKMRDLIRYHDDEAGLEKSDDGAFQTRDRNGRAKGQLSVCIHVPEEQRGVNKYHRYKINSIGDLRAAFQIDRVQNYHQYQLDDR